MFHPANGLNNDRSHKEHQAGYTGNFNFKRISKAGREQDLLEKAQKAQKTPRVMNIVESEMGTPLG